MRQIVFLQIKLIFNQYNTTYFILFRLYQFGYRPLSTYLLEAASYLHSFCKQYSYLPFKESKFYDFYDEIVTSKYQ